MARSLLLGVFLLAATSLGADDALKVRLTPHFSTEPGNLMITVAVAQDRANRALEVAADSGTFYRSSSIQLDGDRARISQAFTFSDMPAGEYDVTVRLVRTSGESVVHASFQVLSVDGDDGGHQEPVAGSR